MRELDHEIARLRRRAEQLLIHIQHLGCGSAEASVARANLDSMLQRLVAAKAERDRLLDDLSRAG